MPTTKTKPTAKLAITEKIAEERNALAEEIHLLLYREAAGLEVDAVALSSAFAALGWDNEQFRTARSNASKGRSFAAAYESHAAFEQAKQELAATREKAFSEEPKLQAKIGELQQQIAALHRDVRDAEGDVVRRENALPHLRAAAPQHIKERRRLHNAQHIAPLQQRKSDLLNKGDGVDHINGSALLAFVRADPHHPDWSYPIISHRDAQGQSPWVMRSERGPDVINAEVWQRYLHECDAFNRAKKMQAELDALDKKIEAAEAESIKLLDYWLDVHAAESVE